MNLTGKLKTNDDMDRDIEEGASTQTWYRRTAELGLALAIILNKPPEQSGRQYTEYLVTRLQSRDESWKAKAEELQEKVLQLQQELFLTKMLSRPESRGERGESSVETLSQDVLCSTSHEPNPEEDSGCDTGNTGSLLPSQELGDLAVQQASSRREVAFGAWNFESKKVKAVHFHTKFLRNVLGLRRIKELGNATPDPLASDQNYSIIRDSVCQLLDCVSFLYRDCKAALPSSLLLEAGQAAASAVEQGRLCEQACTQFVKKMEEFLKEFTGLILENNQLNRFQTQESIADFLILLGRSSLLKSSFVCHLLSEISHFADEVQQACQNQSQKLPEFDIARYENTFYLFWILEQLLQTDERGDGPLPQDLSELRVWHQRLQKNFLCLSDEFPLFAIYMWRIGAYLCTVQTQK